MGKASKIDKEAFVARVRTRRIELDLDPRDVWQAIGIKQQTYDNVERGKVARFGHIIELAEVLQTTPQWLWYEEGAKEAPPNDPQRELRNLLEIIEPTHVGAAIRFLKSLGNKAA